MTDEVLDQGIALVKAGRREDAARILARIVQEEPGNDVAWAWLSACFDEKERRLYCLDRAIKINPQNLFALDLLARKDLPAEQDATLQDGDVSPADSAPVEGMQFDEPDNEYLQQAPEAVEAPDPDSLINEVGNDLPSDRQEEPENPGGWPGITSSPSPIIARRLPDVLYGDGNHMEPENGPTTGVSKSGIPLPVEHLEVPQWSSARRAPRKPRRRRRMVSPWLIGLVLLLLAILIAIVFFAARFFMPAGYSGKTSFNDKAGLFIREAELMMSYTDGSNNLGAFKAQHGLVYSAFQEMSTDWPAELSYQKDQVDLAMQGWSSVSRIADLEAAEGDCVISGDLQAEVKTYTNSLTTDKTCPEWAEAVLSAANGYFNMARPGLESYHGN